MILLRIIGGVASLAIALVILAPLVDMIYDQTLAAHQDFAGAMVHINFVQVGNLSLSGWQANLFLGAITLLGVAFAAAGAYLLLPHKHED